MDLTRTGFTRTQLAIAAGAGALIGWLAQRSSNSG